MAVYKVPQDVEADDKLIGPFSFRQFIYLVIVALGLFMAWALSRVFIGLAIIPLPIVLFFGALALPLRKDQPMEIYLAAIVKFFFKPKIRLWQPEGQIDLVTITAPKVPEGPTLKSFTGDEANQRLAYLSQIVDTQGWASRGVSSAPAATSLSDDIVADASTAEDVMDETTGIGQQFDSLIEEQDAVRKHMMMRDFQQQAAAGTAIPSAGVSTDQLAETAMPLPQVSFNPYPTAMHQRILDPRGNPRSSAPTQVTVSETSETPVSPDIIRLASNNDLSISAIAREAHRIENRAAEDEVVITLR